MTSFRSWKKLKWPDIIGTVKRLLLDVGQNVMRNFGKLKWERRKVTWHFDRCKQGIFKSRETLPDPLDSISMSSASELWPLDLDWLPEATSTSTLDSYTCLFPIGPTHYKIPERKRQGDWELREIILF